MATRKQEDDARLVRGIETGDRHAASLLWRRHAPMVRRILRRHLGGSTDVEDLAQDVFLIVFRKLRDLRTPSSLRSFIAAVTARACFEQRRKLAVRQRAPTTEWETPDRELVPRKVEARIALSRLLGVLGRVHPTDRTATMLRYVEMRPLDDIASALDLSLASVKRRIARGSAKVALLAERDPFLAPYAVASK
jgi:RNA polymerase sigma-70 factor (ECF subfamily)